MICSMVLKAMSGAGVAACNSQRARVSEVASSAAVRRVYDLQNSGTVMMVRVDTALTQPANASLVTQPGGMHSGSARKSFARQGT